MNALQHLALPLAVIALAGCHSRTPEGTAPESDKTSLFQEGQGVLFSNETKKLLGVEMAEVIEKPMQRHVQKTAQVYRAGREGVPGSAMFLLGAGEAKTLKAGQPVKLRAGDAPEFGGTLVRLDTQSQGVLGQVEGLVEFADPQQGYPAGAFVTVTLTEGDARPVLVVPESAVLLAADGSYVYALNGSHLTRTRVTCGAVKDGFVGIEDGLYAGDSIAARGVDGLWLVELSALKGGTPCCPVSKKTAGK